VKGMGLMKKIKRLLLILLIFLMNFASTIESKNKALPFEGFYYTTGKTIKFYDLSTNAATTTYSSQADEINGLYYDSKFLDLYFTETENKRSKGNNIIDATYIVRKLNIKSGNVLSIYKEIRKGSDLNYYLFPEYRYNNFLLFDIEGFECSYHKVFDL
jgi:hypothetical protein